MRLCFAIPDLRAGGAEKVLSSLANWFAQTGHEVHLICFASDRFQQFYTLSRSVSISYVERTRGMLRQLDWAMQVKKTLNEISADILVCFLTDFCICGSIAAWLCHTPCIVCERNSPRFSPSKRTTRWLRNISFCLADGCVFQTERARDYFPKAIIKKSTVIANPIVLGVSPLADTEEREKRIVAVGRYIAQKNYSLLLSAFLCFSQIHPEYTLDIYGRDCGSKDELTRMIEGNEKIRLHDEKENIHEIIRDAGMYILTSDYEGMPNALAEAIALGIPAIATDCANGPAEIIRDASSGLLIPQQDMNALISAMCSLAEDRSLSRRFSENGKLFFASRSISRIAGQWEGYINSVKGISHDR